MDCLIRKVQQGDEFDLAYIQTESWKAAFKDILSAEILQMSTNLNRATAMYKRLLDENIGNGYILEVDSHPHCIAWWDTARDNDMPDYAELICIHSLQDNWRKGFGTQMMSRVMGDMRAAAMIRLCFGCLRTTFEQENSMSRLVFSHMEKLNLVLKQKKFATRENYNEYCFNRYNHESEGGLTK